MSDINNRREATNNAAAAAADGKNVIPGTRDEHAGADLKEPEYPYIAPPDVWAPIIGPRG